MRGSNFTKEEQLLLLEEVVNEKHIIECKITNKTSNSEKEKAWERVKDNFNAKNLTYRTMEQIKSKYDNLKTKARKVVSSQKVFSKGTGGGPFSGDGFDPVITAILNIINVKTVVGLNSEYGGDSVSSNLDTGSASENPDDTSDVIFYNMPSPVIAITDLSLTENVDIDISNEVIVPKNSESCSTALKAPIEAFEEKCNADRKRKRSNDEWSNYTPRKLKRPINAKLQPTLNNYHNSMKEDYYKLKIEFLKNEIEEQRLRAEREMKEDERKQEKHELETTFLKLQIKKFNE